MRRPDFHHRLFHVRFVVYKMALRQVFPPSTSVFLVIIIHPMLFAHLYICTYGCMYVRIMYICNISMYLRSGRHIDGITSVTDRLLCKQVGAQTFYSAPPSTQWLSQLARLQHCHKHQTIWIISQAAAWTRQAWTTRTWSQHGSSMVEVLHCKSWVRCRSRSSFIALFLSVQNSRRLCQNASFVPTVTLFNNKALLFLLNSYRHSNCLPAILQCPH